MKVNPELLLEINLFKAEIMHHRLSPKKHFFKYKAIYISIPFSIDNYCNLQSLKEKIAKNKLLFSVNKFNLFSFYEKDYLTKEDNLQEFICNILKKHNIKDITNILLITQPRFLSYIFNPVSFFLCLDKNKEIKALLSQVNNKSKQSFTYISYNKNNKSISNKDILSNNKEFYVSPFLKIEGNYNFRIHIMTKKINIFINYFVKNKLKLSTYLKLKYIKFNNLNLILSIIKMPLPVIKTSILIYYNALLLFLKKIKFYKNIKN